MTGVPMMRSMVMEFQDDPSTAYLDRQYMLGDSLMVAPVFNEKGRVSYYLPQGKWTNLFTGEISMGGVWRDEVCDYLSIPLWVRENSILPVNMEQKQAADDYRETLTLKVYGLENEASTEVYEENKKLCDIKLERNGNHITGELTGEISQVKVEFVNEGRKFEIAAGIIDISLD
jgi:alpha-D-xyloside xylohydrolase